MKNSLPSNLFSLTMKQKNLFRLPGLLFYYKKSQKPLIGFSINKKYGGSVERSFFKRRCRSLFFSTKNSTSVFLVVRPLIPLREIDDLNLNFKKLFEFVCHV